MVMVRGHTAPKSIKAKEFVSGLTVSPLDGYSESVNLRCLQGESWRTARMPQSSHLISLVVEFCRSDSRHLRGTASYRDNVAGSQASVR